MNGLAFVAAALSSFLLVVGSPQSLLARQGSAPENETVQQKKERLKALEEERERLLAEIAKAETSPEQPEATAGPAPAAPTGQEEASPRFMETLVVTATRSELGIGNVPAAVTVLGPDQIAGTNKAVSLEEPLRRVPGLRVEDELGGSSRTRIIIRGTGTRANSPAGSGVRGVKVLVDSLPKNNGGGSAQDLINVDLQSAERIEVLRGPSSVLYGNQSGGVVNVITQEGGPDFAGGYHQTVGSYGLFRERAYASGEAGALNYFLGATRTDQDGYREQSDFDSTGFHGKFRVRIDDRSDLFATVSYDRLDQQTPGPLTAAQFDADPRQADPVFVQSDVRALVEEMRLGLVYRRELFGHDELNVTGYYTPRHLGPFFQIGVRIPQDFTNRGGGIRYLSTRPLGGLRHRFTIGSEYQNTPITTGVFDNQTGAALSALEEHADTAGIYALDELGLTDRLTLTLGGRFDWVRFRSENLALATEEASRSFSEFSPKVGLSFRPRRDFSLYANYGESFETPIIGELRVVPGGTFGFNTGLDPQRTRSYEIGARGEPADRLTFEAALFRQEIRDYISPFGTFPNNSFQNVGRVRQNGVELGTDVRLGAGLSVYLSYTYSDFVFDEFRTATGNFDGNELPGVPPHGFFGELRYRHSSGLTATFDLKAASSFFVNDANTAKSRSYEVMNLRLGYDVRRAKGVSISPFLALNNLASERYSEFALINDTRQRYFNPLPGFSVYGGVGISFR